MQGNNATDYPMLPPLKKNGFSFPYPWQQLLTWLFFVVNTSLFGIFSVSLVGKVFTRKKAIAMITIYIILTILVLVLAIISTIIDPIDPSVEKEMLKKADCARLHKKYCLEISKNEPFCIICCANIDNNSKHCKKCNKCVEHFDHHCNWLNNCIGKPNYYFFYVLLLILIINLFYNTSLCVYIFTYNKKKNIVNAESIVSLSLSFLDFVLGVNLTYLFVVHTWLRIKGITTYEYILSKLEKEQKEKEKEQVKENGNNKSEDHPLQKQAAEIFKVNNFVEGNSFDNETSKPQLNKNRNKVMPKDLIEKLDEYQKKTCYSISGNNTNIVNIQGAKVNHNLFKFYDEKIIIEDEHAKEKIFQPMVDEIYRNKTSVNSCSKGH